VLSKVDGTNYNTTWTTVASGGGVWGAITGTLSSQTDLQSALDAKLSTATAATTYAPLASPSLTGTPLSTTAAVDTNSTQIATTAFVVAQAAAATPLVNGTAAVGTSLRYARADHVHGTDTTRAPLASPTFTGTPTLPTGTIAVTQTLADNSTKLATTAYVDGSIPANKVKAWVNFNGTGTPAIRASYNVSSITDNGVGDYTVNFTTAMTDADYAMSAFAGDTAFTVGVTLSSWGTYTQTTSAFRLKVYYSLNSLVDATNILATFIR
jgi:hypothetical protein